MRHLLLLGAAGVLLLVVAACSPETRERIAQYYYEVREVRRYGAFELESQSSGSEGRDRTAAGAVLAAVDGIVETGDGLLHVLDRKYRKIVVFTPAGELMRVIVGGHGEGPGEFVLPVDMTLTPDSQLAVLDYELHRVSFFAPAGQFLGSTSLQIGNPIKLLMRDNLIWVQPLFLAGSAQPLAVAFDFLGNRISEAPALTGVDRQFGGVSNFALGHGGSILFPLKQPGLWLVFRDGEVTRRGVPRFPGLRPPELGGARPELPDALTIAIAPYSSDRILIWYAVKRQSTDSSTSPEFDYFLDVFTPGGDYLGTTSFPDNVDLSFARDLYVSTLTKHIYVSAHEPYPTVVELQLVERPIS